MDKIYRNRTRIGQALGDADEPQPTKPWLYVGCAP